MKGQVQEIVDLILTPEPIASTLPLDISQVGTKVATINEKSNVSQGYKIKVVSTNQGNLKRTGGNELFSYSITYNNLPVDLQNSQTYRYQNSRVVNTDHEIKIFYVGVDLDSLTAGEYSDTLTFTISTN